MKKILVAIDFSKITGEVVKQAAALAKGLNAKVWVVHVAPDQLPATEEFIPFCDFSTGMIRAPFPDDIEISRGMRAEEYKREHQALLNLSGNLRQEGVDAQAILMKGDIAELILEKAENLDVDIIVLGSHGYGLLHKVVVGSVSEAVLRKAMCNVLIVPAPME